MVFQPTRGVSYVPPHYSSLSSSYAAFQHPSAHLCVYLSACLPLPAYGFPYCDISSSRALSSDFCRVSASIVSELCDRTLDGTFAGGGAGVRPIH